MAVFVDGWTIDAAAQVTGEALVADRFDEVFTAGARLNRRQARAVARERRGAGTGTS